MSDSLIKALGDAYDSMPYESHSFPQSAPEQLCAIANLFGLNAPAVEGARVLEIGCASGGNIIPFALRHPKSRVVGIDLSAVQVASGQARIAELGIKNAMLKAMNIADSSAKGSFDYIICHGVYSWVPQSVQTAILRVCGDYLSDTGVAYISYNTYPGWKMREIVRDAMMLRASTRTDPGEKLSYARGMLDFIEQVSAPNSAFRKALEENLPIVRNGNPYYLHHEFLELCNSPCYFRDFLGAAEAHGLAYLGDAEPKSMFVGNYGAHVAEPLLNEVGGDQVLLEQYLDFVSNRSFRQTLLIKSKQKPNVKYGLDASRIKGLHFAGQFEPVMATNAAPSQPVPDGAADTQGGLPASGKDEAPVRTWNGNQIVANNGLQRKAFQVFNEAYPSTLSLAQLAERMGPESQAEPAWLSQFVEGLLIQGHLRMRTQPLVAGRVADGARTHVSAAVNAGWGSGLWHDSVQLDALNVLLLKTMESAWTQEMLLDQVALAVQNAGLSLLVDGLTAPADGDKAKMTAQLQAMVPDRLRFLERFGFFAGKV